MKQSYRIKPFLKKFFWWVYRYLGFEFIWRKFFPKDMNTLPTGFIWLLGIYAALFGIASQRYENRVDIIENRVNSIIALMGNPSKTIRNVAFFHVSRVQNMSCPRKPDLFNPVATLLSLTGEEQYHYDTVEALKQIIESFKTELDNTTLIFVDFRGTDLRGANLQKANLWGANLQNVDLRGANLQEAILIEANLQKAGLRETILSRAHFGGANLSGAYFKEADLRGADLRGADLSRADLSEANLWGADLRGADLRGAENLTLEQLSEVKSLHRTKFDPESKAHVKEKYPHLLEDSQ